MQLVLNQYGSALRRKGKRFVLHNAEGKHDLSPTQLESILITRGASISSDAILLAVEQDIDVLILDQQGQPQARIWSHRFGSISQIRKQQLRFASSLAGAQWVCALLCQRLGAMQALLQGLQRDRPAKRELLDRGIGKISILLTKFQQFEPEAWDEGLKAQFRGWEGAAARAYFQTLAAVVPEAYHFERRSRRPAEDMFNCALNYLYGMLYGRLELALIKAGVDPYLGVMHRDEYNRPVLVYDLIEGYRVWAEAVLLQLCFRRAIDPSMFSETPQKGMWLEDPGKKLVITAFNDYLHTVIQYQGKRRSRLTHMQEDCHALAKEMLAYAQVEAP